MSKISKFELISKLNCIIRPTVDDANEYQQKIEMITEQVDDAMSEHPHIHLLIGGERNYSLMIDHHKSHASFMENLFYVYDSAALVNSLVYMINIYEKHGFPYRFWKCQFKYWIEATQNEMSEDAFARIQNTYEFISLNILSLIDLSKDLNHHRKPRTIFSAA